MRMNIRQATVKDLDVLTNIQMAAFPMDPQWDYRFPRWAQFPEDTREHTNVLFSSFLEDTHDRFRVMLAEIDTNEQKTMQPIAHAVWETANLRQKNAIDALPVPLALPSIGSGQSRRDANLVHMKAFHEAIMKAKKVYFDDVYGTNQIHLMILGTHPDYQRQGAGSSLCRWGMDLAKDNNVCVSVFGSPMGKKLYAYLGFSELATIIVQAEGEEAKLYIAAMVYEAHKVAAVGWGPNCLIS